MREIRMRPKHQLTLPAHIVREAQLVTDDKLEVSYANGVITLTPSPKSLPSPKFNLASYAGIGQGLWGNSTEEINQHLAELRS